MVKASSPLPVGTQYLAPQYSENALLKRAFSSPSRYQPLLITRETSAVSSGSKLSVMRFRSR